MTTFADLKTLPGADLVQRGVSDLDAGSESAEALLVSIGAPRLRSLGIEMPSPIVGPEHKLYLLLAGEKGAAAHSRLQRFDPPARQLRAGSRSASAIGDVPTMQPGDVIPLTFSGSSLGEMRRAGWRPERRNRKLGTPDWAWRDRPGGQATFDVPWPTWDPRLPEDSWTAEAIEEHHVHGQTITVVSERLRKGSVHPCAPAEACAVLKCLPAADVAGIGLVVLRQPTRKQDILTPAWGRMHWCVEFRGYTGPAIALDAVDLNWPQLRWSRSLSPDQDKELGRMRQFGFAVTETRRSYEILLTPEHLRRWVLGRTLPHEVGHWVDFRQRVLDPLSAISTPDVYNTQGYEDLLLRWWGRPHREREQFADRYADEAQPGIERCIGR